MNEHYCNARAEVNRAWAHGKITTERRQELHNDLERILNQHGPDAVEEFEKAVQGI